MMKLFHFLGGIRFAIILITSTALLVVLGTLIESKTESHLFAAKFSYSNPIFTLLLVGFFVNILFAALRRWPYKSKHIPFLITHIGLLMLLGGVMIKRQFGVQGTMFLAEGTASHQIFIPETFAVQIDSNSYDLKQDLFGRFKLEPSSPDLKLLAYSPNAREQMNFWIKGNQAMIHGIQPFQVFDAAEHLPLSTQVRFDQSHLWDLYAFRTTNVAELAERIYLQGMSIRIIQKEKVIFFGTLSELLQQKGIPSHLHLNFSPTLGFVKPYIEVNDITIPLDGNNSLKSKGIVADLERNPTLLFVEDPNGDQYFFAFDSYGRVHAKPFRQDNLTSIIAYDQGRGGYAIQKALPFTSLPATRRDCEKADIYLLTMHLQSAFSQDLALSPPLQILKEAAQKTNEEFVTIFLSFLDEWHQSGHLLYPKDRPLPDNLDRVFKKVDLNALTKEEQFGCHWSSVILNEIEQEMDQSLSFIASLEKRHWPLLDNLKEIDAKDSDKLADTLTTQIFSLHHYLPNPEPLENPSSALKAHLLSTFFRTHSVYLSALLPSLDEMAQEDRLKAMSVTHQEAPLLETPLTAHHQAIPPKTKLEENQPVIQLQVKGERLSLVYDRFASGLKWPILGGNSLIRFQPKFTEIPYRIRLRNARQINYPNSTQPFSFESDLLITDRQDGSVVETTISMNNVHETREGYRFYLSNISPPNETAVKRIQLIVNYDPAKYYLTYPGAIILSLGIIMLFWLKPYQGLRP